MHTCMHERNESAVPVFLTSKVPHMWKGPVARQQNNQGFSPERNLTTRSPDPSTNAARSKAAVASQWCGRQTEAEPSRSQKLSSRRLCSARGHAAGSGPPTAGFDGGVRQKPCRSCPVTVKRGARSKAVRQRVPRGTQHAVVPGRGTAPHRGTARCRCAAPWHSTKPQRPTVARKGSAEGLPRTSCHLCATRHSKITLHLLNVNKDCATRN
jgi:hypothetical protein